MTPPHPRILQRRLRQGWVALIVGLVLAVAGGCETGPDSGAEALSILSASSLSASLPGAAARWTEDTGRSATFSFDATSRLAAQVEAGAPADVLITADRQWMDWVAQRVPLAAPPRVLLRNRLVVIAGPTGPLDSIDFSRLRETGDAGLVLAGENVPAGRYAEAALRSAGLWDDVSPRVLRSGSARAVLEVVASGAAPLGIVYATDPIGRREVRVVAVVPPDLHAPIEYLGAVLAGSQHPAAAGEFLAGLTSPSSAAVFLDAGFALPPAAAGAASDAAFGARAAATVPPDAGILPSPGKAIFLSLIVAVAATLLGLPVAVLLGWLLARKEFRGRTLLSTLVLIPLVLPPVVTGFLLLSLLSPSAPLGAALAAVGLPIPFTLLGAVLAAFLVGMPLYVAAVRGAFSAVDPHLEEVAWTLGVKPRRTFWRVTLPLAAPGIAAGAILAFARALGEFGATVVLAGNMEGQTRTIALAVYTLLEAPGGRSAVWVLVGASVLLSALALVGYELLSRRQRERGELFR